MIAKGDNKETPRAVWPMKEPILHILSKGRDDKPTNVAKRA